MFASSVLPCFVLLVHHCGHHLQALDEHFFFIRSHWGVMIGPFLQKMSKMKNRNMTENILPDHYKSWRWHFPRLRSPSTYFYCYSLTWFLKTPSLFTLKSLPSPWLINESGKSNGETCMSTSKVRSFSLRSFPGAGKWCKLSCFH